MAAYHQQDDDIVVLSSGSSRSSNHDKLHEFASITGADPAVADFFLTQHGWSLEAGINAYFTEGDARESGGDLASASTKVADRTDFPASKRPKLDDGAGRAGAATKDPSVSSFPAQQIPGALENPDVFRVVSWNIDEILRKFIIGSRCSFRFRLKQVYVGRLGQLGSIGEHPSGTVAGKMLRAIEGLDHEGLANRAEGVCIEIVEKQADVVFLQEVVPANLPILTQRLAALYETRTAGIVEYFTTILLRKATMQFVSEKIVQFPTSRMGRNLFIVKATFDGVPVCLMTSHLESTKEGSAVEERKKQLCTAFAQMASVETDQTVIFGGDLNLRDTELKAINGIPKGIVDLYTVTGSRKECANTWDTKHNVNAMQKIGRSGGNQNFVCRFDRLYFRPSDTRCSLIPAHFNLVGLKKAPNSQRFPSDHWGIMVTFDRKL